MKLPTILTTLPRALYSCKERGCAEETSWFPEDLIFYSFPDGDMEDGYYCELCEENLDLLERRVVKGPSLKEVLTLTQGNPRHS